MHELVWNEVSPGHLALVPDLEAEPGPAHEAHNVGVVPVLVGQHGARVVGVADVEPEGHGKLLQGGEGPPKEQRVASRRSVPHRELEPRVDGRGWK